MTILFCRGTCEGVMIHYFKRPILNLKDSRVVASTASLDRLFQSPVVLGKNENLQQSFVAGGMLCSSVWMDLISQNNVYNFEFY